MYNKNKKPLVSILIMTYNHEDFIANTIESCLNQSYDNIEICVGDDCSSDSTARIVEGYAEKYPKKVKLVKQNENKGKYSLAINYMAILEIATGEFFAILDGDELMLEFRIEKQVQFLLNNHDYIAVSNEKLIVDSNNNVLNYKVNKVVKSGEVTTKDLILYGNVFSSCYMTRAKKETIKADTSLKVMGDWYSIIKMSIHGKLGFLEEKLTKKIIHGKNVTITKKNEMSSDSLITLALIDYNYPEYSHIVTQKRIIDMLSRIKNKDYKAIKNLFNFSIFVILKVFFDFLISKRNRSKIK